MDNLNSQKTIDINSVFGKRFLNNRSLYLQRFNRLPCVHFMDNIEGEKAYHLFKSTFADLIESEYQYRWFNKQRKKYMFDETIFIMKNNCIIELDDYCEILHDGTQQQFLNDCTILMNHAIIQKRLNKKNDKGIVLLHGLPGTGKTSYLRFLVGNIRKRVLFLSSNVAGNLMDPDFIDLLIDNPNTVVIIEDAENIIMDRRLSSSASVSNLLNISDGLLADFLNVQLVCTFNSPVAMVDSALMRKGRLIAKYEFGKLSVEKAGRLSNHLGFSKLITEPMTLAEIVTQEDKDFETRQIEVIGFRTNACQN